MLTDAKIREYCTQRTRCSMFLGFTKNVVYSEVSFYQSYGNFGCNRGLAPEPSAAIRDEWQNRGLAPKQQRLRRSTAPQLLWVPNRVSPKTPKNCGWPAVCIIR